MTNERDLRADRLVRRETAVIRRLRNSGGAGCGVAHAASSTSATVPRAGQLGVAFIAFPTGAGRGTRARG